MSSSSKSASRGKRDASSKLAEHRLSVLELAKELGNVAEACRRRGMITPQDAGLVWSTSNPGNRNKTPTSNATTEPSAMNGSDNTYLKQSRRHRTTRPGGYGHTTTSGPTWPSVDLPPQ